MEIDIASTPVYAEFNMGTLVYLAFALVAFIVNQINKSKKKQQQQRSGKPDASTGEGRPAPKRNQGKSFEELLEEFTGNAPKPEPARAPAPIPVKRPEVRSSSTPPPVQVNNPYQDILKERSFEKKEESHRLLKTPFKRFDEFEDEEEAENDYSELLSDADSARKAFVLSEIFQRKY